MKVTHVRYSEKNGKVSISAQLVLKSGKTHSIYFQVDKEFKNFISKDASPFLAASLGISMQKKEDLVIDGVIARGLTENTSKIMKILKSWNLGFSIVSIKPNGFGNEIKKSKSIGSFFSGGADSFYTYLKNKKKIDYLIFVHGFDIKIGDADLYKKIEKNIARIAEKENVKLLRVKTNIRETFEQYFDWDLSHEFAIASVALFLQAGFKEIYASCGLPNKKTDHHFMTPDLDPLWSTESMKIIHYGCEADKIIKLKVLSNKKIAMKNLRVCWVNKKKEYNCGECEKCFRNMLALYVSNSLEKCETFDKSIDLKKLSNTRISEYNLKYFIAVLENMKKNNDISPTRFALEECIKNNKYPSLRLEIYRNTRDAIRYFDKKYNRNRLYWFLAQRGLIS